jgi:ribosomal protein S20
VPNIQSAKKRVKVTAAKALRNRTIKSALHTSIKKADVAIVAGADNKEAALKAAVKSIDKAVAKGILHKKTAARRKSRLVLAANKSAAKA